jgi:hypothetical protein
MPKRKIVEINMGASPVFLEHILTKDVSTLDALYDLIDNSIDAARDSILKSGTYLKDKYDLPNSYLGYKVEVIISNGSITIEDNCLGMTEETLVEEAFVIAQSHKHEYGIGLYGIGLKRSLLKMGEKYDILIDNGKSRYELSFSDNQLGGAKGKVQAFETESHGCIISRFTVVNLKPEVRGDIESRRWYDKAVAGLEDRYSVYFEKDFVISLIYFDKERLQLYSKLPSIRQDSKFLPVHWLKSYDGVNVIIDSGIHGDYYFPTEEGYSLRDNRKLTNQFGIYFICNDRVIRKASTEINHGWKTKWHSEYNGFICFVRFIAKDPGRLPWNTAKSDMRNDSPLFLEVIDEIQPIADNYRSDIKRRYPSKSDDQPIPIDKEPSELKDQESQEKQKRSNKQPSKTKDDSPQIKTKPSHPSVASKNKNKHTQNWTTLLPENFPISNKDKVLDNIIIEATTLTIAIAPHASLQLYRSLLEASLTNFANKKGVRQQVKDHYYTVGDGKGKNHDQIHKDSQGIDLWMISHWMLHNHETVFPFSDRKKLKQALIKVRAHVPKMNGVVHCQEVVSDSEVTIIRNETVELLEFLVTLGESHKNS